jgi:Tol biopolymer transport system component
MVRKAGKGQLMLVTADGSESRTLTGAIDAQGAADWAPDGSAIVTGGSDEQGLGLFRIPIDGGTPVQLAKGLAINPVWSPDGSLIVYAATSVSGRQPLAAVRREDAGRVAADTDRARQPRASVSPEREGHRVSTDQRAGGCGDWGVHRLLAGGSRRQDEDALAHLSGRYATLSFDITPDGKRIVFDLVNDNSDIVLIDIPK